MPSFEVVGNGHAAIFPERSSLEHDADMTADLLIPDHHDLKAIEIARELWKGEWSGQCGSKTKAVYV